MNRRTKLFIGHAHPEDNQFSLWLASRLQLSGYEVWIDRQELSGGEKFWRDVDGVIRNEAAKYLLVYSINICKDKEPGNLKNGVSKEISLAESVAKHNNLSDFIIPLNIDGSSTNLYIGSNELNPVFFNTGWAEGLHTLLEKLQKDNVPVSNNSYDFIGQNKNIFSDGVINMKQKYFTNWLKINTLPQKMYVYKFFSEDKATAARDYLNQKDVLYPFSILTSNIITFNQAYFKELVDDLKITEQDAIVYNIEVDEVINSMYINEEFPYPKDAYIFLNVLVKKSFQNYLRSKRLYQAKLANGILANYFPSNYNCKVNYLNPATGRNTRKTLAGKHLDSNWHFAVSVKADITPFPLFSLKSHIVFSNNGYKIWEDKEKMHSERRKKGKRMFNKEWSELLFAFVSKVSEDNNDITIKVNETENITINGFLDYYDVDFDFFEPKGDNRHNILRTTEDYEDELIENDDENDS